MVNEVYWCQNCNVPLVSSRCNNCDSDGRYVSSGLKPVFKEEHEMYTEVSQNNGGEIIPNSLFRSKTRLIHDGRAVIRFIINGHGLEFSKKDLDKENIDADLSIEKIKARRAIFRANLDEIKEKEREAIEFIRTVAEENKDRFILISFSGGKDSTVAAHLVMKAIGKHPLLFSNTGIEFPETVRYVRSFSKKRRLKLLEYKALNEFIPMCEKLGPPSRMMRWCCFTQKAAPINDFYREKSKEVLSFDGIRKCESKARSKYPRVKDNTKIIKQLSAYPIFDWNDWDIWTYILYRELEFNRLYRMGYTRVGCWACPSNSNFDNYLMSKTHPELFKKWESFLLKYARRNGRDKEWVKGGLWRQRKTKYQKFDVCSIQNTCRLGNKFMFTLKDQEVTEDMLEFFKIFGRKEVTDCNGEKFIQFLGDKVLVAATIGDKKIRVKFNDMNNFPRLMHEVQKQLTKSLNCVACGACIGSCPYGAIKVNGRFEVDQNKCTGCRSCTTSRNLKMACVALHYKTQRKTIT